MSLTLAPREIVQRKGRAEPDSPPSEKCVPRVVHMLKIACHQNFSPHYRKRLFELLCRDDRIQFTILSDKESDSPGIKVADLRKTSVRWVLCPTKTLWSRLFWHPKAVEYIRREKQDAVITIGSPYVLTAWILLLWGRIARVPVILWTHGLLRRESGLKGMVRLTFYRLASALLLYGDYAKSLLCNAGIDPRRMFVIYNSLDSEIQNLHLTSITPHDLYVFRSRIGIGSEDRVVIFCGRLQANKKLGLLLEAVGMLRLRNRVVHVIFVGEGNEKASLDQQAGTLGITSQVHFLGETYDERFIATAFMTSDLSVIPSGAGLSVMHALGYGVPVLLHDRPEEHFPEWEAVQEGKTGFFYRYGDIGDMAAQMEIALFPTPRKIDMTKACLSIIRDRYNAGAHAEAIVSAVREIIVGR